MLITEEYRKLNENMHETKKLYGTSGARWAPQVESLCQMIKSKDVLDYGCGKSTLAHNLPFSIQQYDPAIPKFSALPQPAHIVICTDVLEHIEPECIDDVLEDIRGLTKSLCFLSIANGKAEKTLADGRNAHLIQQDETWWLTKLLPLFHILQFQGTGAPVPDDPNLMLEYVVIATPK